MPPAVTPKKLVSPEKRGAWNVTSCNRLVADRNEQRSQGKHLYSLYGAQSQYDYHAPKKTSCFTLLNKKAIQMREAKEAEIRRDNGTLFQKIAHIHATPSRLNPGSLVSQYFTPRSMHEDETRQENCRIGVENRKMVTRLQEAAPTIQTRRWLTEEQDRQALKRRVSQNAFRNRLRNFRMLGMPPRQRSAQSRASWCWRTSSRASGSDWAELSDAGLDKCFYELELAEKRASGRDRGSGLAMLPEEASS